MIYPSHEPDPDSARRLTLLLSPLPLQAACIAPNFTFAPIPQAFGLGVAPAPRATRILVVDDDEWVRDVLARVLIRNQYHVSTAASAEEALEILAVSAYDLLVSDMMMTGMDGLQLTARVAEAIPDLPIILITAHGNTDLMRAALRQGASDFIPKPFNIETIPLIIERNLERRTLERQRYRRENEAMMVSTVQMLAAAIDAKEPFTAEHSRRVAGLALPLAQILNLDAAETLQLELAAQVHDVGKIGTPDYILNKPGKLTEEEWQAIRHHPIQGAEIVGQSPQLAAVVPIVRHHHEWVNGTGYPDGLTGDAIPYLSRVIAVVDAYEVITADRVYRARRTDAEARERLQESAGSQFDAAVVHAFLTIPPDLLPR